MAKIAWIIIAGVIGAAVGGIILFLSPFFIGFGAFRQSLMHLGIENWGLLQYLLIVTFCAVGSFLVDLKNWEGGSQACASSISCGLWAVFFLLFVRWVNHYPPNTADFNLAAWLMAISFAMSWGTANLIMRYLKSSMKIQLAPKNRASI